MKSKAYILSQIKEFVIERHGYTEEKAERYAEFIKKIKFMNF